MSRRMVGVAGAIGRGGWSLGAVYFSGGLVGRVGGPRRIFWESGGKVTAETLHGVYGIVWMNLNGQVVACGKDILYVEKQ